MNVAIVYHSHSGRTRAMAEAMGRAFDAAGHSATVRSIEQADAALVEGADLLCTGCPTWGLFVILQHPTSQWADYVGTLGDLKGKRVVLFTTYLLATGRTLEKMEHAFDGSGAEIVGRFRARRPEPGEEFAAFVRGLS